jgi:F0F1-type ATP synthase assembly protein I
MIKAYRELGRYGTVGIDLVVAILLLGWIGHWLDGRYFGDHGWGTVVGVALGLAVGVRNLVRVAQRAQKDIERAEAEDPEGSRWTVDESWVHKDDHDAKPPPPPPN